MTEKSQLILTLTAVILLSLCIYGSYRLSEAELSPASFEAVLLFLAYLVIIGILIFSLVMALRRILIEGRLSSLSGGIIFFSLLGISSFALLAWLALST